jgi:hypothetical protein
MTATTIAVLSAALSLWLLYRVVGLQARLEEFERTLERHTRSPRTGDAVSRVRELLANRAWSHPSPREIHAGSTRELQPSHSSGAHNTISDSVDTATDPGQ